MTPIADAPLRKMIAKVRDCLRWSQMCGELRPWLLKTDLKPILQCLLAGTAEAAGYRCPLPLTLSGPQSTAMLLMADEKCNKQSKVRT
jgi:hypothetical protein